MKLLEGKTAVVTGAAKGIGAAVAERFLQEGADKVALLDVTRESLDETAARIDPDGGRTIALICDVSDPASVGEAFSKIDEGFGKVDILVNNAGITRDAMFHKMTYDQFDAVLKVSLYGAFNCSAQVVNGMRERQYGRIISLSSMAHRGNVGQANYAAAKAGIIGLTKTMAMELSGKNITANCIAPGVIDTDMVKTIPENVWNEMIGAIPAHRPGEPEEVASLIAYLASEEAAYISGQCINISGGWW